MLDEEKAVRVWRYNLLNMLFNKNYRLITKNDYSNVFANKRIFYSAYWQIFIKKDVNTKLGLAIAKKNHRLAVNRNRLKRIVREFFRINKHNFNNLHIVVLSKKHKNITNAELTKDLSNIMKKCAIC